MATKCFLCNAELNYETLSDGSNYNVNCKWCGKYIINDTFAEDIRDTYKEYLPKISCWNAERTFVYANTPFIITRDSIQTIINSRNKTIQEKYVSFLLKLYELFKETGEHTVNYDRFYSCYVYGSDEFRLFFQKATNDGFIEVSGVIGQNIINSFTFEGLLYIETLGNQNADKKNIFFAFHFTDDIKEVFDNTVKQKLGSENLVYDRVSSGSTPTGEKIDDAIIAKIKNAKIVVADCTNHRTAVYFEAGFAMGMKIPVIWTCKADQVNNISFDVNHYPFILWNDAEDLAQRIVDRIKAIS